MVDEQQLAAIVEQVWSDHGLDDMSKYGNLSIRDGAIAALKKMAFDLIEVGRVMGHGETVDVIETRLASGFRGQLVKAIRELDSPEAQSILTDAFTQDYNG